MKQDTKKVIVERIVRLANNAISEQERITQAMSSIASLSERTFRRSLLMNAENIMFILVDEMVNEYEELLKRLLQKEGWGKKFSEDYLAKAIQKVLASLIKEENTEAAEQYFDQLIDDFETYSREYIVYVPLANIQMQSDTFSVGNVVFRKMTEYYVNDLIEKSISIVMLTLSPPEVKEVNSKWTKRRLEQWKGMICSEFHIVAEPQRAKERAEEETRRVLDLLRYSIPVLYQKGMKVTIGLQGEALNTIRTTLTIPSDGQSVELHSSREGSLCPFELSPTNIEKMEQIGVLKVADILKKSHHTDFERTLLRGIHWFATSQNQAEAENQLLNLITCLETFLTPPTRDPISNAVAEGVAFIIATELESRIAVKKKIKDLYGKRSAISHGGEKEVLETDIAELKNIVLHFLIQMIERKEEFLNQKELFSWIERQKMK